MRGKAVSGIMLTLLLIGVLTLAFNIQLVKAEPRTWTVDDDGPADFHTIQDAVDAASDGDTIFVYNGTYAPVVVDKALSLVGENRSVTIIEGSPPGPPYGTVSVLADDVNVTGFTIRNSLLMGIALRSYLSDINVSNNFISDCSCGILAPDCNRITIIDNIITRTWAYGIELSGTTNSLIINNTITNNLGYGINDLCTHGFNTISGNTITCNNIGVCVSGNEDTLKNNIIAGNIEAGIQNWDHNNVIFHNSFFNKKQVVGGAVNVWDDGYPSGGNYWSDYPYGDEFSGPNQDQPGSDGIGDEPYVINENNIDRYPLMTPFLLYEHDLVGSVWAPDTLITGTLTTLEATVYNLGLNNETDVELQLLVNDVVMSSEAISELVSGSFFTLNYMWTPTVEGLYNVAAYVAPVPNEFTTLNNVMSTIVNVYTPPTEPTRIYLSPSETCATVGSTFTINVMVANVEDLYTWQIRLYFDPTILNCTAAWYPTDHVFAGKAIAPVMPVVKKDEKGTYITYGCTLMRGETTFYGSGTLCKINFTGTAVGLSTLEFSKPYGEDTFLWDGHLDEIPAGTVDGQVTVLDYPPEDLNRDGKVDMKDLATAALAFGSYPTHPRWNPIADTNKDDKVDMRDLATIAKSFGK